MTTTPFINGSESRFQTTNVCHWFFVLFCIKHSHRNCNFFLLCFVQRSKGGKNQWCKWKIANLLIFQLLDLVKRTLNFSDFVYVNALHRKRSWSTVDISCLEFKFWIINEKKSFEHDGEPKTWKLDPSSYIIQNSSINLLMMGAKLLGPVLVRAVGAIINPNGSIWLLLF